MFRSRLFLALAATVTFSPGLAASTYVVDAAGGSSGDVRRTVSRPLVLR